MEIIKSLDQKNLTGCHLTIGNFDGIHQGHRALIEGLVTEAQLNNRASVLLTFNPNPRYFFGETEACTLTDNSLKYDLLEKIGLDCVIEMTFDQQFSKMSADQFLLEILLHKINPSAIVVGENHTFGYKKEGTVLKLKEFCHLNQIEFSQSNLITINDKIVSSSSIRSAIKQSDFTHTNLFLGRPYGFYIESIKGNAFQSMCSQQLLPGSGYYLIEIVKDNLRQPALLKLDKYHQKKIMMELHRITDKLDHIFDKKIYIQFLHHICDINEISLDKIKKSCLEEYRSFKR